MSVKITVDRLDEIIKATRDLGNKQVLVGVPSTAAARDGEPEVNNAAIAYWMEFGVPEKNIPARPFLFPGVRNYRDRAVQRLKKAGQLAIDGQPQKADEQLNAVGLEAVSSVRKKITEGPFVPLAPATIAARRRSDTSQLNELYKHQTISSQEHVNLTGTQPLIDTGKLRQAINYVIRKKNGRA